MKRPFVVRNRKLKCPKDELQRTELEKLDSDFMFGKIKYMEYIKGVVKVYKDAKKELKEYAERLLKEGKL